jgi:hypothetical protein
MLRQFFKLCFTLQNQLTHTQLFFLKTMKTKKKKKTPEKTGSRERGGKGEREPDGGFAATTVSHNNHFPTPHHITTKTKEIASSPPRFHKPISQNQSLMYFKLDLQTHLNLICKLLKKRMFSEETPYPPMVFHCHPWQPTVEIVLQT